MQPWETQKGVLQEGPALGTESLPVSTETANVNMTSATAKPSFQLVLTFSTCTTV